MIPHQARLSAKRKIKTAARRSQTVAAPLPPAWFLTDPVRTPDPLKIMMHLPRGWGVVYRHFGAEDRMKVASDMQKAARSQGLFLSASFDETLLSLRLDGVHWPRWMLPKRRSAPGMGLQSSSAHSHRGVTRAERSGMDVCFVSSVFPSDSPTAPKAMGVQRFRNLSRNTRIPLIALGGVTADTACCIANSAAFASIGGLADLF